MGGATAEGAGVSGYPEVFMLVGDLGYALGVRNIKARPGCWEHSLEVDPRWELAVNAHAEPTKCSDGFDVPAYSLYVRWNGWPAGIINAGGGTIAAGEGANEAALIAALKAEIALAQKAHA